jgi:hypothetical protein
MTDIPTGPGRRDVTPLPDLLHGRSRVGPVRQERPVYVDLLPPCNAGCPAGENIQAWLAHAETGDHEGAWRQLTADNPMPAIHGRVCYHPCESVCNRASLDSAVSIHSVERFLGDLALELGWSFDPPPVRSGRRVLVIGAGPSGLSAAYHLARLGHEVELRDAGEQPGGMMRYGIPAYRMPRDVLDGELDRIAAMGVRITLGHRVEDLDAERREGGFDAAFVAVGAHLSKRVDIPAKDAGRIVDAVSFLRSVASGERPVIGRRVAVYGGGNTAMDAARVARRLGANDALIVYRRTRAQMRAFREAEAYDGPSLVIAYSHCIAHGIEMRDGLGQQYRAVASAYWPLVRYDPVLRTAGGNPFMLDSPRPRIALTDYTQRELRYRSLGSTDPAEAERLGVLAQEAVDQRWDTYEEMAARGAHRFPADARKES